MVGMRRGGCEALVIYTPATNEMSMGVGKNVSDHLMLLHRSAGCDVPLWRGLAMLRYD